jgi:hypothetical protein
MLFQVLLIIFLFEYSCTGAGAVEYGVALTATPVMNIPDFSPVFGGKNGKILKTDRCGQVRELEFIALPGSVFTILKRKHSGSREICQVETKEYEAPFHVPLYVDNRFLRMQRVMPAERSRSLPLQNEIVATLRNTVGIPYVWGGNIPGGIPELEAWFYRGIRAADKKRLTLAGLDCSGLLYYSTGGWIPRNTSQLLTFGQSVVISGKLSAEIALLLQPLDLIAWNGHVIIVLDQQTTIESRLECGSSGNGGVILTPLTLRLAEIMRIRRPVDDWPDANKYTDIFVVRRWYPQQ